MIPVSRRRASHGQVSSWRTMGNHRLQSGSCSPTRTVELQSGQAASLAMRSSRLSLGRYRLLIRGHRTSGESSLRRRQEQQREETHTPSIYVWCYLCYQCYVRRSHRQT